MAEIPLPPALRVIENEHHLTYEGQVAIGPGAWSSRVDVLNRGYPAWTGVLEIMRTDDEAAALAIEAFLNSFEGRANWARLPLHRPATAARMTVEARGQDGHGTLWHSVNEIPVDLDVGHRLASGAKVYSVRSIQRAVRRLVLDPQRPIAAEAALGPATHIAARLVETEHPPMPRRARVWGPWAVAWREM